MVNLWTSRSVDGAIELAVLTINAVSAAILPPLYCLSAAFLLHDSLSLFTFSIDFSLSTAFPSPSLCTFHYLSVLTLYCIAAASPSPAGAYHHVPVRPHMLRLAERAEEPRSGL